MPRMFNVMKKQEDKSRIWDIIQESPFLGVGRNRRNCPTVKEFKEKPLHATLT